MFKTAQIISASKLTRDFPSVCRDLDIAPHAVLVPRRNGDHVVLLLAEVYEDLIETKFMWMHQAQTNNTINPAKEPA